MYKSLVMLKFCPLTRPKWHDTTKSDTTQLNLLSHIICTSHLTFALLIYTSCLICYETRGDQRLTFNFSAFVIEWLSFAVAGPSSWNALPVDLRFSSFGLDTFAKHLKTHLFGLAYSRQSTHFWVCITFCRVRHGDSVTKPDYYYYYYYYYQ